jgi:hypothetical protein
MTRIPSSLPGILSPAAVSRDLGQGIGTAASFATILEVDSGVVKGYSEWR